jgi:hypothetical protein
MENETFKTRAIVQTPDGYHAEIRSIDYTDNTLQVEPIEGMFNGTRVWVNMEDVKPIQEEE